MLSNGRPASPAASFVHGISGRRRLVRLLRFVAGLGLLAASGAVLVPEASAAPDVLSSGVVHVLRPGFGPYPELPEAPGTPIRGYGFVARVTEEACGRSVGSYPDDLVAPAGEEVCAFFLRLAYVAPPFVAVEGEAATRLAAAVATGATEVPITGHELDDAGQAVFALDVPTGADPVLRLSAAGLSESWSLTTGRLVGEVPEVLSGREPSSLSAGEHFVLEESALGGGATAKLEDTVASAGLSWFEPGDPSVHPPSLDEAFLVLRFTSLEEPGPSGASFGDFEPLPGTDVRVELPGGRLEATRVDALRATGLLDYPYFAVIPASSRGVRVLVTPGVELGAELDGAIPRPVEVRFSSASVPVGSPVALAIPTKPRGPSRLLLAASSGQLSVVPAAAASGGATVVLLVVPVLLRRRRAKNLVVGFPPAVPLDPEPQTGPEPALSAVPAPPGRLSVRVLGPVVVEGLTAPLRAQSLELCVFLVLEGRPVGCDELRHVLGDGTRDLAPKTVQNRVHELKEALGKDVMVRRRGDGYVFEGVVSSDWASFEELRQRAEQATDELDGAAILLDGLQLVRGVPFASVPKGHYRWALEPDGPAAQMGAAVQRAAVRAASVLAEEGMLADARTAARLGLRAAKSDRALYRLLLSTCTTRGELEELWPEVVAECGDDAALAALHRQLLGAVKR